jgi:hypothetical protein
MNILHNLKIYLLNTLTIAISFTQVESALKIVLLLLSIIYTVAKIKEIKDAKNK